MRSCLRVSPRGGWEVVNVICSEVAVTIATAQPGVEDETTCWYVRGRRTWLHAVAKLGIILRGAGQKSRKN